MTRSISPYTDNYNRPPSPKKTATESNATTKANVIVTDKRNEVKVNPMKKNIDVIDLLDV